ncbi:MAG: ECF transporter S component, partial [Candidatus Izemoplasmatales bacterium]|nr:ECF transporter S component [Candidatus Izemoplasmatales bacterium]
KMKKELTKREKTRQMTILSMFIAIVAVLGLVPNGLGGTLGFIKIAPTLEATIIHIPVLIGAALLGRKFGIYLGLAFGVISNIAAFIYGSPLFYYPWVAILPRFIFGLLIYDVTMFFVKITKNKLIGTGISFFLMTLLHTLMVLTMMLTSYSMVFGSGNIIDDFIPYVTLLFVLNVPWASLIEMTIAAIVGGIIVVRLSKYLSYSENSAYSEEISNEDHY